MPNGGRIMTMYKKKVNIVLILKITLIDRNGIRNSIEKGIAHILCFVGNLQLPASNASYISSGSQSFCCRQKNVFQINPY